MMGQLGRGGENNAGPGTCPATRRTRLDISLMNLRQCQGQMIDLPENILRRFYYARGESMVVLQTPNAPRHLPTPLPSGSASTSVRASGQRRRSSRAAEARRAAVSYCAAVVASVSSWTKVVRHFRIPMERHGWPPMCVR
jgi:hypothetical protein